MKGTKTRPAARISEQAQLKTNRVFQVLSALEPTDLKRLEKFLNSPYFNQSKTLSLLSTTLLEWVEKGKSGFDKEKVWNKIFPQKTYNDINFRKACSDLLELVETFMATEAYLAEPHRKPIEQIEFLLSRKVQPLYRSVVQDQEKLYDDKQYLRASDYHAIYAFENKYNRLMNFDVRTVDKNNIEKISDNLDLFYLIEKLRLFYNILTNRRHVSTDFDLNDADAVFKLCEKYDLDQHPELAIYYYSYHTSHNSDNIEFYYKLKATLEKFAAYIPMEEATELFDTALNYCVARTNKGVKQFLQEYFDIFNVAIKNGVFIVNGEMADRRFTNIVIVGLRLGKTDWAYQFVSDMHHLLPAATRMNTYKFNMGRVHFYKKEFGKVLEYLHNVDYDDIFVNLNSRVLFAMSYYELDEYDALDNFLETYRTFINRQKELSESLKTPYLNFIGFVRRMTRLKPNDPAALTKLRDDIVNAPPGYSVNQDWLVEKVKEI